MFKNKTYLGVDTRGRDIKIVELRKSGGALEVVQAVKLKGGGSDIGAALGRFLLDTDTRPHKIAYSMPASACSVKFARLPETRAKETAKMVYYEAETQIPLPLNDLVWGYSVADQAGDDGLRQVVIAAARRETVAEIVSGMEEPMLPDSSLQVSTLAGRRALSPEADDSVILLDMDEDWADLTAVSGKEILSCRSTNLGVGTLVAAAAADLDIELEEAEELIGQWTFSKLCAPSQGKTGQSAVEGWVDSIVLELRRSALSAVSSGGLPVSSIILSGRGAAVSGIAEVIAEKINLPVEIGNPWAEMQLGAVVKHGKDYLPAEFTVATGLAISAAESTGSINLMPGEHKEARIRQRRERAAMLGLGIAAAVLFITILLGQIGIRTKSAELDDLKGRVAVARHAAVSVQPGLAKEVSAMQRIADAVQNSSTPIEVLRRISQGLPKSCWISELRFDAGKLVVLRGGALSDSAVADAVYQLSGAGVFESVSMDYCNLGTGDNKQVYEFQIKCALPPDSMLSGKAKTGASKRSGLVVR